jgi:hypothetical protein
MDMQVIERRKASLALAAVPAEIWQKWFDRHIDEAEAMIASLERLQRLVTAANKNEPTVACRLREVQELLAIAWCERIRSSLMSDSWRDDRLSGHGESWATAAS